MNNVSISGNVGRDPSFWSDNGVLEAAYIRVAINEKRSGEASSENRQRTDWVTVRVTNKIFVEYVKHRIKKGAFIVVGGKLRTVEKKDAETGATSERIYVCVEPFNGFIVDTPDPKTEEEEAQ